MLLSSMRYVDAVARVVRPRRGHVLSALLTLVLAPIACTQSSRSTEHWVTSWSASIHAPVQSPGQPPAPVFDNQTIRMVVRPTVGSDRVRIRLSNAFGTTPLRIGTAHIALAAQQSAIVPRSDHALTFGGRTRRATTSRVRRRAHRGTGSLRSMCGLPSKPSRPLRSEIRLRTEQGSTRQAVSQWIRTSGAFDGVVDFRCRCSRSATPNSIPSNL